MRITLGHDRASRLPPRGTMYTGIYSIIIYTGNYTVRAPVYACRTGTNCKPFYNRPVLPYGTVSDTLVDCKKEGRRDSKALRFLLGLYHTIPGFIGVGALGRRSREPCSGERRHGAHTTCHRGARNHDQPA